MHFSQATMNLFPAKSKWIVLPAALLFFVGNARAVSPFVLVDNYGDYSITKYDYATGAYQGLFTSYSMQRPLGMTSDADGNVYIADLDANTIEKFSVGGTHLATFTSPNLSDNEGMVVSNGYLYSASYNNGIVEKFSLTGTDQGVFATVDARGLQGMVSDASGNLYVADYNGSSHGGTIQMVATNGSVTQFATMSTPIGMAIDTAGNIYASDPIYGHVVHKFTSSGADLGDIITGVHAYYMAMDASNVLYAPLDTPAIEMYSTSGADLGLFTATALNSPLSVIIVPEPSAWILLLTGTAALVGFRRRKRWARGSKNRVS